MFRKKKVKDTVILILKIMISLSILSLIFYKIGITNIYSELSNLKLFHIIIAILITPLSMVVRALRWTEVIKTTKEKISLKLLLKLSYISLTFGLVTPGRIGEFIKVHHLTKKTGITFKKSLYTAILDKFLDIFVIITLSMLGFYIIFNKDIIFLILFFVLFILSLFFFMPYNLIIGLIKYFPFFKRYSERLSNYKINIRSSVILLVLSYVIWLSLAVQAFIILRMLGASNLSFIVVIGTVSLMAFSSFVPITIGGLGVREVIAIMILLGLGITAEKAALFSLLYTFVSYGVISIVGTYYIIRFK